MENTAKKSNHKWQENWVTEQIGANCILFILGTGPLKNKLTKLIKKLNLTGHVILAGHVENPFPIVDACDCFVLSSDYEGQPMVLLEALALEKYCIGTDIPSIRYVLDGHGELVKADAEAFGKAIVKFTNNPKTAPTFDFDTYLHDTMEQFYSAIEVGR